MKKRVRGSVAGGDQNQKMPIPVKMMDELKKEEKELTEQNKLRDSGERFLSYVLVTAIILECNSLLRVADCEESSVNMNYVFAMIIAGSAAGLGFLKMLTAEIRESFKKEFLPILLALEGYIFIYFALGVLPTDGLKAKADYAAKFIVMLPLLSAVFYLERREGQKFKLLNRFANAMSILSFLNLTVYYTTLFHINELRSEQVYLHWYNRGTLSSLVNCLNVCFLKPGAMAQSFHIQNLRDFGPYTEPLMFLIPLGIALFTVLFLSSENDSWRIWKVLLLSATIFTVQSTNGLVMLVLAWGLKLLSLCSKKELKIALLPVIMAVGGGAGYFVKYKAGQRNFDNVISFVMQNKHFTDYVYAMKAFLHNPLAGGGYLNEDYIVSFFEEKAKDDIGLSNTVSVVLGQGGIVLGLLCMLPFVICLWQMRGEGKRNIAIWSLGPLYLYVITVFHYRFLLILIFAFGYSLLDVQSFPQRIRQVFRRRNMQDQNVYSTNELISDEAQDQIFAMNEGRERDKASDRDNGYERRFLENVRLEFRNFRWKLPTAFLGAAILFAVYGNDIWNRLFEVLYSYQLTVGQSSIRVMYGVVSLIACVCWYQLVWNGEQATFGKIRGILYVTGMNVLYILIYPVLYSYIDTVIFLFGKNFGMIRETLVLCVYLGFAFAAQIFYSEINEIVAKKRKPQIKIWGTATGVCVSLLLCIVVLNHLLNSRLDRIVARLEPMKQATALSSGKVYTDELAALYKRALPDISYTAARGNGFRYQEKTSVLEPIGRELPALFEEGFQVAQLSDDYLLYSNDESVITGLTKEGYAFHRYYAFEREYDVTDGREETLQPGRYTVTFELKIDPERYEGAAGTDVVCKTQVSHNFGEKVDQTVEVKRSDFNEEGKAEITNILSVGEVTEGYAYRVTTEEKQDVDVSRIRIQQTPFQITLKKFNVHHIPIYEAYYDKDGTPSFTSKGYAAVSRSFNCADKVTEIRYLNAENQLQRTTDKYAEVRYDYNSKLQVIREAYYDENGDPILLEKNYSEIRYVYNARGNRTEYRYCDSEGDLVNLPDGFAMFRYRFDDKGRWIRREYYDSEENKVLLSAGYCTEEREYNSDGLCMVNRFLGIEDEPVMRTDLYSEIRYTYDDHKRIIRQEYYNTEGKRTCLKSGISAIDYERDRNGNVIREEYFGANDEKILTTAGVAEVRRRYNSLNQKVSDEYFGIDGKPILVAKKYVKVEYTYDANGKMIKRTYRNAAGKVVEEKKVE